jgi:hypothetical protein
MALVFDRRAELAGQPLAHAFVVGVSEYTHLPTVNQPADPQKFELRRLASPALSAWDICRWLVESADKLDCKLATIRLLMSPSTDEMAKLTPIVVSQGQAIKQEDADPADWDHFVPEALAWRQDAATNNRTGLTFFYYSGHGLERYGRPLITLADFTNPLAGGVLSRSCEVIANFVLGMAPAAGLQDIARRQFYFVDACREYIKDVGALGSSPGTVWDPLPDVDDRATPIFMGSYPGAVALTIRGKPTDFCAGLIKCLGDGAEGPDLSDPQKRWPITNLTLSSALTKYFTRLKTGQYAPAMGAAFGHAVLRWLDTAPPVEFSLRVQPTDAVNLTTVSLRRFPDNNQLDFPASPANHPYKVKSVAGIFDLTATASDQFQQRVERATISPDVTEWSVIMTPAAPGPVVAMGPQPEG